MRTNKDLRELSKEQDSLRRGTKLPPIKKSGKERHNIYSELDEDEDELLINNKRESIFDYFDEEDEEDD